MSNSVSNEVLGTCLIVKFIRPEIRNPLSVAVLNEINRIIDSIEEKTALVFTGTENVFASGANLNEIAAISAKNAREFAEFGQAMMATIAGLRQTTVAAINGYCFGGALDLALACDMRIAAPSATFSHPGAGLGIITGWGGTQRLPRLIGEARALEMFFTTSPVTSADALSIGLVDRVETNAVAAALAYLSESTTSEKI